ncbi:fibronectin type III domain-containing protein [Edaphobacter dinghuensis]|uniref:Fibronectin type-III domain-containing protein n=1 Tax=Edaphobacter dinghuensis TaxID=1560005 RepID=A0A917H7S9_9BACT|nr:fibronectin type III domain-containing protein [Edaphobacter dinghuensis]GGG70513.1 hypothetical protein GCM10011585_10830 [Edaphobacter dinghuensis]
MNLKINTLPRIRCLALALPTMALLCASSIQAQIYVSPKGSDAGLGTVEHPVQTLVRARDLARTTKQSKILLAGGTYRLTKTLELSEQDSGVSFAAIGGSHPIISGAVQITGWKKVDAKRNLWQAPAPAALTDSRQLYVNGVRTQRAKGPVPVTLEMTPTGYIASDATMSQWKNISDIEFVYTGGNSIWNLPSEGLGSWTQPRCPIASIKGTVITMAQPCWDNSTKRVMLPSGVRTANLVGPMSVGKQPSYVENAFELLQTPGQWYFDRSSSLIYYIPRPGEDLARADVEVPVLQFLVALKGTASQPIHDVTFSGIQFSYATWLGPNTGTGFSEIQANYQVTGKDGYSKQALCHLVPGGECPYANWTKAPGNISVAYDRHIQFLNDVFAHLGAAGLDFASGSQDNVVEGSIFTDISGNGLQLGGVEAPLAPIADFTSHNRIDNNLFRNVGAEYRGGIGIVVGYARDTVIAHNEMEQLPYAAISIGWGGWPDKIKLPGQANNSANNLIADNSIHDFMLVLSDGGGIYTQGRTGKDLTDGEKITGNVIRDQYSSGHGIYADNGSAMMTIRNNVVFHTEHDNINSRHRDYYDGQQGENFNPLDISNNWWQQGDVDSDKEQVRVQGNRIIYALAEAPAALLHNAGLQPKFRGLEQRQFAVPSAPESPSRVASFGVDRAAYVTWSPSVFEGGSPVTSYTVTASNGNKTTISAAQFMKMTYMKFNGLTNGQSYTFTVRATNAQGTSTPSLPSYAVTATDQKIELPGPPAKVEAFIDHGNASIHFQTPDSTLPKSQEPPIIAYVVTIHPSGRKVYFTGRNVIALQESKHVTFSVINGLKPGENYSFSVSAINPAGEGKPATTQAIPVSK